MKKILSLGLQSERSITDVEVVTHTEDKAVFKFEVDEGTSENYVRKTLFGEGQTGHYYMQADNGDPNSDEESETFYGYTKVSKVVFANEDDVRYCTVTLVKPSLNEFISDVYKELALLSGDVLGLTMNIGGAFADVSSDTTRMMMSQLLGGN